jgi:hypothetical protein
MPPIGVSCGDNPHPPRIDRKNPDQGVASRAEERLNESRPARDNAPGAAIPEALVDSDVIASASAAGWKRSLTPKDRIRGTSYGIAPRPSI